MSKHTEPNRMAQYVLAGYYVTFTLDEAASSLQVFDSKDRWPSFNFALSTLPKDDVVQFHRA